jgi:hypothetical protein
MLKDLDFHPMVIPAGSQISGVAQVGNKSVVGLITPEALTSTAVTFEAGRTGTADTVPLYGTDGTPVSVTVAADRWINLTPSSYASVQNIKLVMGSIEAAERTIYLVTRDVA